MKKQDKLPAAVSLKLVTTTNTYYLIIRRTVGHDLKPLPKVCTWNPPFIAIDISEHDADRLRHSLGVPIEAGITL